MIDGLETALESPLSSPSSLSLRVASLHSPRTSTYLVWRAKFTRNTQWNLIFRAHTFVFGHLTHHLPSSAIVRLFDTILRLFIEKGILSPFESVANERREWNLGKKSIKRDYIGWKTYLISWFIVQLERKREILSPQNSPRRRIICRMLVNLTRSFSVSIQSVCNRDSDIYFRLEQAEVKYGKNICLSDGIFGS